MGLLPSRVESDVTINQIRMLVKPLKREPEILLFNMFLERGIPREAGIFDICRHFLNESRARRIMFVKSFEEVLGFPP